MRPRHERQESEKMATDSAPGDSIGSQLKVCKILSNIHRVVDGVDSLCC